MARGVLVAILLSAGLAIRLGMAEEPDIPVDEEAATEVTADRIEYARDRRVLTAAGNVTITRGGRELRADRVTVKTDTSDVWASGNVVFKSKDAEWRCEDRIYCNLKTEWVLIMVGRSSRGPMPSFQWYSSAKQPPGQRRFGVLAFLSALTISFLIPRSFGTGESSPTQYPS